MAANRQATAPPLMLSSSVEGVELASSQNQPLTLKPPTSHPQSPSKSDFQPRPDPTTKLIASKPMEEDAASKRSKRKVKSFGAETSKKTKTVGDKPSKVFNKEDEIVILKGMIDYKSKYGVAPESDPNGFLPLVSKSLSSVKVKKEQLYEKMRTLRKKYDTNSDGRGENWAFSKPHDKNVFKLSKKIWGTERDSVGLAKEMEKIEVERAEMHTEVEANGGRFRSFGFWGSFGGWSLDEEFVSKILKDEIELISSSKKVELEGKCKEMMVEEMELYLKKLELYLKKLDLMCEQVKLVLEAMKS